MTIYCDESGGLSAGTMTFAAVLIEDQQAHALLNRMKDVTGLRGELKGSRIGLTERALFYELLSRFEGRAIVAVVRRGKLAGDKLPADIDVYDRLLENLLERWQKNEPNGHDVVVDDGRYDPEHQRGLIEGAQKRLGSWGKISVADSRRNAGVQIADVIANTVYNLAIQSSRADRIRAIVKPFIAEQRVQVFEIDQI